MAILQRPCIVPDVGLLIPLAAPLRVDVDDLITVVATFKSVDELGVKTSMTQKVAEVAGGACVTFLRQRMRGRAAIVLHDVRMPKVGADGRFELPPHDPIDGLLVFGPCR